MIAEFSVQMDVKFYFFSTLVLNLCLFALDQVVNNYHSRISLKNYAQAYVLPRFVLIWIPLAVNVHAICKLIVNETRTICNN